MDPESPRSRYNMGTIYSMAKYCPDGCTTQELHNCPEFKDEFGNFSLEIFGEKYIWLPIYSYERGGLTICCVPYGCSWDSGLFGIIAVSKDKAIKELGLEKIGVDEEERIQEILIEEIKTLDQYYTNEVYGYEIEKNGNIVDSSFGYFGSDSLEEIEKQCMEIIENQIAYANKLNAPDEYEPS